MDFFLSPIKDLNLDQILDKNSVLLGLDVGDTTVGVAVSDRRIKIASGITTISRKSLVNDCNKLQEAIKQYKIGGIIVGWPIQMNGIPGTQCEKVLKFAQALKDYFDVPFFYWDERLSTCAVNSVLLQADLSRKKRKNVVDKSAAVYILQGAIDFLNRSKCKD